MVDDKSQTGNDPADAHIGARLHSARAKLGMSTAALAHAIGVSERDIDDFEEGRRRIGATCLCDLCRALDLQISYFFSGYTASSHSDDSDVTLRVSKLITAFLDLPAEQQEAAYSVIRAMADKEAG